jgi:hypothetical protein
MTIPDEFSAIRPYEPDELPAAFERLFSDAQFCGILDKLFPGVPQETLRQQFLSCTDTLDFQKKIIYGFVKKLMATCSDGCSLDAAAVSDKAGCHTFVSNHRDIVLDAALLDVLILDAGFRTTVEIAIGDNLLALPWIETLVKLNKSFLVRRNVGLREMLAGSQLMSRYMHYAVAEKHENIWIAQREGRAKDSNDRTQEALLKMMAMGGEGTPAERLRALHITPLTISYEYDPCDYLKAKEFQQKRDDAGYKKSKADDVLNMYTGITGYKGRVHYCIAPGINTWLDEIAALPKSEFFPALAARTDREIHRRYRLYANNYVAADLLDGGSRFSDRYTDEERQRFVNYLEGQLAKIDLPQRDDAFLRERLLTMYANPLKNYLAAQ